MKTDSKLPYLIFAVALALRLLFMVFMITEIGSEHLIDQYPDPVKYIDAADYLLGRAETGRYELYLVGIGYPLFIGTCTAVTGQVYWPILLIQTVLSSLSCVIIYKTAKLLLDNRIIAFIAGLLAAGSLTSISLANAVLSETLFFFLFALSLYMFFKGLVENRWSTVISAGVWGGLAVLVRSVAMFFPVFIAVLPLFFPPARFGRSRKPIMKKSFVVALIMMTIPALWGIRNSVVHDTLTISGTGILATRTYLTAKVLIEGQNRHIGEFTSLRDSLYRSSLAEFQAGNYRRNYSESSEFIMSAIRKYPSLFLKNYFLTILDNATVVSSLHHIQLPQYAGLFERIEARIHGGYNNPTVLIFSLIGFVIILRKNVGSAVVLISVVVYFAMMSGVTFAQGSRIFYPAMVTQAILVTVTILFLYELVVAVKNLILFKIQKNNP